MAATPATMSQREAASFSPSWHLQSKRRVHAGGSLLSSGGFGSWTDVPPVGTADPHIATQMRFGKRVELARPPPSSSGDAAGLGGGKRMVDAVDRRPYYAGKRLFPDLVGSTSTSEARNRGLKRVESRARKDEPSDSNPNTMIKDLPIRGEGVLSFPERNQVRYKCWAPDGLAKSEGGDWNWNTTQKAGVRSSRPPSLGFRRVSQTDDGQPKRSLENPIAWPSYPGYPPDCVPGTSSRIDYAVTRYGGSLREVKGMHPDVLVSMKNRVLAGDPNQYNQSMRCRGGTY